ncbi:MAG: hypothetical protein EOP84_09915 [Verrucomicrobiaceae bacterium]|nr:MAG: hypothetical protein EOP84_09915 [Verrucomicrobiaceae bacterium]
MDAQSFHQARSEVLPGTSFHHGGSDGLYFIELSANMEASHPIVYCGEWIESADVADAQVQERGELRHSIRTD